MSFLTFLDWHILQRGRDPKKGRERHSLEVYEGAARGAARENYNSMIPLFSPIIAAWVRSLAPNFERMFLTRLFTVSSVIES